MTEDVCVNVEVPGASPPGGRAGDGAAGDLRVTSAERDSPVTALTWRLAATPMITNDFFLAKDFNRISVKILRDH
jgi:hypothetical protein